MRAEMQGMEAMPIGDLIQMEPLLRAVMEPSRRGHAFMDLSNDLIASIAAQQNITQETAKNRLKIICDRMIAQAHEVALIKLISMPQEEALEAFQTSTNEPLNNFIQWFFNSSESAQANFKAVIQSQCQDPYQVASALITLHRAGLLTGDSAQANRDALAQSQDPNRTATALIQKKMKEDLDNLKPSSDDSDPGPRP